MPGMRQYIVLPFFIMRLLIVEGYAQNEVANELNNLQLALKEFGSTVLTAPTDEQRQHASTLLQQGLLDAFELPEAFEYPFDSLTTVSRLLSSDRNIRLITWTIPAVSGNTYHYAGILFHRDPKTKAVEHSILQDSSAQMVNITSSVLRPEKWYGALYYDIITTKNKKEVYYTVLGWKGNNTVTTKKVIDVIGITDEGPAFGAPVFVDGEQPAKMRQVYEFSAEVAMSIHYEPNKKVIILDHLFPSQPSLEDYYEFYGPDLSFDAYALTKGKWVFIEDYDPGIRPPEGTPALREENSLYRSGN